MRPFHYQRATNLAAAHKLGARAGTAYLAGGTTLYDLMKLDVSRPSQLVDIRHLPEVSLRKVAPGPLGITIGALVTMAELMQHPGIERDYPVLFQSLALAASQQLRNMATLGGNVLQRTRCSYFRDTSFAQCNKRVPGSGCAARTGVNRGHAILGTSPACIATYPGDLAQALIALDAIIHYLDRNGRPRSLPFSDLHRLPGETPHIESRLASGELITGFVLPGMSWPQSCYVKIRDRESYAFANASAAVALRQNGDRLQDVRIGLGGVATIPWRAKRAEAHLRGKVLTEELAEEAAALEFADAKPLQHNHFKLQLGQKTLIRALLEAGRMQA